ncbi:MAG: PAS domain S-box protein [Geobacteraceae bacterium]
MFIIKEEEKRKGVEEALREEQRRLEEIIDFLPDATLVIDNTGKVTAWNRAIEKMTGIKAEEMIGKGNYEYAIPFYGERRPILIDLALLSDDEFLTVHYDDIHRQDAILSGEVFVPKTYGGKGAYLWATASTLFNTDGKIVGAIESIHDITKRKSLEKALQESEEKYRRIVDTANEGIWVVGADFTISFANARMAEMLGCSDEEMIGRLFTDFMIDEDVPDHLQKMDNRRKGISENYERWFLRKDGQTMWTHVSATPIFDAEHLFKGSFAMFTDITERKRMENVLRESEERFRTLTEKSPVGVYIIQDDLFRYVNPTFAEIFGYAPEEIIDRLRPVDFITPEDRERVLDSIRRRTTGEIEFSHHEFHISRKDGSIRVVETFGSRASHHGRPAIIGTIIDITERKSSEERLFQVTERWERTFNAVPDLIAIIDSDFRIVQANKAMAVRLGSTHAECAGKICYKAIHKTEAPPSFCPNVKTLKDSHEHMTEVSEEGLGGDFIVSTSPIYDSTGQLVGSVHVARDITERKRAEQAVEESRNFLDKIINSIADPIFVKDRQHRWVMINDAYCDFMGYKRGELLGRSDYDFFPKKEADVFWSKDEIVFTSGKENINEEELTDAKGIVHTISTKKTLYTDDKGEQFIVGIIRDITEQKLAQDRLQEQLHFLQELIDDIPTPVLFRNVSGEYLGCNKAFEEFLGIKKKDIVGKSVYDVHPKEIADFCLLSDRDLLDSPETTQITETTLQDASGAWKNILFYKSVYTTKDASIGGVVGTFIDITEHRRMQDELIRAQKLESLGLLAGGIAHDFNNILTGIVGNISMAMLQLDPSHKIVNRLELCEKATLQATELTRQLLTFARGGEPVKKLINPSSLIRETVSFSLRGSNIKSFIYIQDDLWSMEVDKSQLSQVLNNLLLNAGQAMPSGGEVTVRAANETLLHDNPHQLPPGDYTRISVEDRGCGIPQENLVRIFDPYFTTKPKGSGLGLASVYSIVKRHGGAIEVSSTPGAGTAFSIHLPALPGRQPEDAEPKLSAELTGSGRVLVMDDEDLIREIATDILDFMGYAVDSCSDGREAVERFRAARENNVPFSAVILDLTIPGGMGGKEAATRILQIDPDAVLIVSSGYSDDPVIANFRQFGFSGVVSKPFDAEGLASEMKRLIPITS